MITIYDYISYRSYLRDWFEAKKKENPRFSHRAFSRRCHQKSPSFLKDLIDGRRNITQDQEPLITNILKLKIPEKRYFNDMICVEQEKDPAQKDQAFERIAAARRIHGAHKIEGESYRYLSRWYCPAVRELANRSDFKPSPEWIMEQLRPKISKKQAKEALQILQDLEMLTLHDDGSYTLSEGSIVTPNQVSGLAVTNYHSEMLKLASEGIRRFDPEDRHYLALTVCVPHSLIPKIKEELNEMAARLLDLCDSAQEDPSQTLQLQLHCFPLSNAKDTP